MKRFPRLSRDSARGAPPDATHDRATCAALVLPDTCERSLRTAGLAASAATEIYGADLRISRGTARALTASMMTNTNFSKMSLAISAILVSSVSIGAAFGADEPKPHDAADQARSVSTAALDIAASTAGRSPVVPGAPSGVMRVRPAPDGGPEWHPPDSTKGGQISRAEVIRRAKYWFDNRRSIPYNQYKSHRDPDSASDRYRQDCSGLVSMALHLQTSLNTGTLPSVGIKIDRTAMQPGDFTGRLGNGSAGGDGHVRIFEKWADKRAGTYWAYDFGETPVKHQIYKLGTDAPRHRIRWTAYRYKKII
jgi:hypothetical protein